MKTLFNEVKEELYPKLILSAITKLSMLFCLFVCLFCFVLFCFVLFCFFEKNMNSIFKNISCSKLSYKDFLVRRVVLKILIQNMENIVLINISRTVCPNKILIPFFSDYLLQDTYIIFQKLLIILRQCTKHAEFWFVV